MLEQSQPKMASVAPTPMGQPAMPFNLTRAQVNETYQVRPFFANTWVHP